MRSNELGPVYGVPLIDTLPLGSGGMKQQMPSRDDLEFVRKKKRESRGWVRSATGSLPRSDRGCEVGTRWPASFGN